MKLSELVKNISIDCDSSIEIDGLNSLREAKSNQISFLENKKYLNDLEITKAGAVLIKKDMKDLVPEHCIALVCENPYLSLAKLSFYFKKPNIEFTDEEPIIGKGTRISKNVYIGKGSRIGDNCTLFPGVFIGDNVTIGDNCTIFANVSIYRDCELGNDIMIHSGTVIGSDGFGFTNTKDGKYIKIYQNGNVILGNDIEIGANCTIDRAAFNATIIEDGVRIDNLVHIAHNCIIGKGSILTGQVGLAGSTILHEYVVMAGKSAAAGHLEIAPFSTIAGQSVVSKTIKEPNKQWAGFPLMEHKTWLKLQGKIAKLLKG